MPNCVGCNKRACKLCIDGKRNDPLYAKLNPEKYKVYKNNNFNCFDTYCDKDPNIQHRPSGCNLKFDTKYKGGKGYGVK